MAANHFRIQFSGTFRAYAVGEIGICMLVDKFFQAVPVTMVIADLLA